MGLPVGKIAPDALLEALSTEFRTLADTRQGDSGEIEDLKGQLQQALGTIAQLTGERDALFSRNAGFQKQLEETFTPAHSVELLPFARQLLELASKAGTLPLLLLATLSICSFAIEIRIGAKMHVKELSMWFETDRVLLVWQRFQHVSSPEVIKSYQDVLLGSRGAWQFGNKLPVKIASYWQEGHQVEVKMLPVGGRFDNGVWWVDDKDCVE